MVDVSRATLRKIQRSDRMARWVITLGGVVVIASVTAILVLIVSVTLPLFRPATASLLGSAALPAPLRVGDVLSLGIDMDADGESVAASIVSNDGRVAFIDLARGRVVASERIAPPEGSQAKNILAVERHHGSRYTLLWSDGSVSLAEVTASAQFSSQGRRAIQYGVRTLGSMPADGEEHARRALMRRTSDGGLSCATLVDGDRIVVRRELRGEEDLFGNAKVQSTRAVSQGHLSGPITALTANRDGSTIYAGTGNGRLVCWTLDDQGGPPREEVVPAFRDKRAITSLAMAAGDVSLVVGDAEGGLTAWFPVRGESSTKLRMIHRLQTQQGAVREILPATRNRLIASLGDDGAMHLDYLTSQRHLLRLATDRPLQLLGYAPRGNALVGLDDRQNLSAWKIDCPIPRSVGARSSARCFTKVTTGRATLGRPPGARISSRKSVSCRSCSAR